MHSSCSFTGVLCLTTRNTHYMYQHTHTHTQTHTHAHTHTHAIQRPRGTAGCNYARVLVPGRVVGGGLCSGLRFSQEGGRGRGRAKVEAEEEACWDALLALWLDPSGPAPSPAHTN